MRNLVASFFRRAEERQRKYALQLIQDLLAAKTEQCEMLREEIRRIKLVIGEPSS